MNQRKERMVIEIISWPISTKKCCRTRESDARASAYQADAHPTELPRPAAENYHHAIASVASALLLAILMFVTFRVYGPSQANLCLRAFRHDKFQLRMPSHSEGLGIWLSVWRFLLTHCLYERAAKVLARLRGCAGSPEPFAARIGDKYQIRLARSIWRHYMYNYVYFS